MCTLATPNFYDSAVLDDKRRHFTRSNLNLITLGYAVSFYDCRKFYLCGMWSATLESSHEKQFKSVCECMSVMCHHNFILNPIIKKLNSTFPIEMKIWIHIFSSINGSSGMSAHTLALIHQMRLRFLWMALAWFVSAVKTYHFQWHYTRNIHASIPWDSLNFHHYKILWHNYVY